MPLVLPPMRRFLLLVSIAYVLFVLGCAMAQRKLLFFPSHFDRAYGLAPWIDQGELIGYQRPAPAPRHVWLLLHGNAGQASDRVYALPCFDPSDSVFILEYPGYGRRAGHPSKDAFNTAAAAAYSRLRADFPHLPVCVVGESVGSGPASLLATQARPPDKIVLIVPFDRLSRVAAERLSFVPVRWIMRDDWDNIALLRDYHGPLEIFGALHDDVIGYARAQALAAAVPTATFHSIPGRHNDWSQTGAVQISAP